MNGIERLYMHAISVVACRRIIYPQSNLVFLIIRFVGVFQLRSRLFLQCLWLHWVVPFTIGGLFGTPQELEWLGFHQVSPGNTTRLFGRVWIQVDSTQEGDNSREQGQVMFWDDVPTVDLRLSTRRSWARDVPRSLSIKQMVSTHVASLYQSSSCLPTCFLLL